MRLINAGIPLVSLSRWFVVILALMPRSAGFEASATPVSLYYRPGGMI